MSMPGITDRADTYLFTAQLRYGMGFTFESENSSFWRSSSIIAAKEVADNFGSDGCLAASYFRYLIT